MPVKLKASFYKENLGRGRATSEDPVPTYPALPNNCSSREARRATRTVRARFNQESEKQVLRAINVIKANSASSAGPRGTVREWR